MNSKAYVINGKFQFVDIKNICKRWFFRRWFRKFSRSNRRIQQIQLESRNLGQFLKQILKNKYC